MARPGRLGWQGRLILAAILLILGLLGCGEAVRLLAPASNTSLTRFDAIIVLGYPADSDGNPTPELLARVTEGVHEYERGVAPRLILTGGAVHNGFVEARVMARTAHAQGIPESAIFIEPEARNTIQNACYAARIMKAHDWRSAEVVSSASHLPRAGYHLQRTAAPVAHSRRASALAGAGRLSMGLHLRGNRDDRALPGLVALDRALRAVTEKLSPGLRCPLPVSLL